MFESRSRRDFLKIAAGVAATELLADGAIEATAAESPRGEIIVRVTDKTRRYASAPSLRWKPAASAARIKE